VEEGARRALGEASGPLTREDIARASTRLVALMLGAEDFAFDMGVERRKDGREIEHARAVVATVARAYRLAALDTPWADIQDLDGLTADAEGARALGFSGKYVIHPSHVEPVNRVFSPTEGEVEQARRVLTAWEQAEAEGKAAVQLDGRMVDRPIVERARALLARAEAIGQTPRL
jgi:citrate lyase subunit beta/citryl-CoA lyase